MKAIKQKIAELLMEQECITDVNSLFGLDIPVTQVFDADKELTLTLPAFLDEDSVTVYQKEKTAEAHGVYRVQFNYYREYCMNDMNKHIATLCLKNNMTLEQLYADLIEKRCKINQ